MNALSIPLSGLTGATARLNKAAEQIVQKPVTSQAGKAPAAPSPTTGGAPTNGRVQGLTGAERSLPGAIVDLKTAEHAYKANITALKTMAETQDSLLEITA
jgi:flagellar basal body rod protein FlgC